MEVLINHPKFGSIWLSRCVIKNNTVEGYAWDESQVGKPELTCDYYGEEVLMNFPTTCIRIKESGNEVHP